uniref:PL60L n=1 Tax=African swine fever virus TaxID=10497 RepID=A0A6G7KTJ4_ASF
MFQYSVYRYFVFRYFVYQYIYYHYYFYAVFPMFYCCNVPAPPLSGKYLLESSVYEEYRPYLL